ncbi:MAG: hypothetical protein M1838_000087 [Thelocarpon superellum]|nr:MAG: hypothetical protein M1838_000087 [Thelocarpon superellum]
MHIALATAALLATRALADGLEESLSFGVRDTIQLSEWSADLEFRATGPERGGGNIQLWYAKDGPSVVDTSSLYTIQNFDGLVLVLDTYGGRGGSIRGFLNDGTVDYKGHHSVESLAFGHCDYSYRNLGRPSKVQVKQKGGSFEVTVDDRPCFHSDKVQLPSNYYLGVSAASAEVADSVEVFKVVVHSFTPSTAAPPAQAAGSQGQRGESTAAQDTAQDAQIRDIQTRLGSMTQQLDRLEGLMRTAAERPGQATTPQQGQEGSGASVNDRMLNEQVTGLDQRLRSIERTLRTIQSDVEGRDFKDRLDRLQSALEAAHTNLMTHLPASMSKIVSTSAPRMWTFIFAIVLIQLALAASYVIYKRRRASAPKKYL